MKKEKKNKKPNTRLFKQLKICIISITNNSLVKLTNLIKLYLLV